MAKKAIFVIRRRVYSRGFNKAKNLTKGLTFFIVTDKNVELFTRNFYRNGDADDDDG